MINRIFIAGVVCMALLIAGFESYKDMQGVKGHPQDRLALILIMCLEGVIGLSLLVVSYG